MIYKKKKKKSILFNLSALCVIKSQVHILHFLQKLEFSNLIQTLQAFLLILPETILL